MTTITTTITTIITTIITTTITTTATATVLLPGPAATPPSSLSVLGASVAFPGGARDPWVTAQAMCLVIVVLSFGFLVAAGGYSMATQWSRFRYTPMTVEEAWVVRHDHKPNTQASSTPAAASSSSALGPSSSTPAPPSSSAQGPSSSTPAPPSSSAQGPSSSTPAPPSSSAQDPSSSTPAPPSSRASAAPSSVPPSDATSVSSPQPGVMFCAIPPQASPPSIPALLPPPAIQQSRPQLLRRVSSLTLPKGAYVSPSVPGH
ncbi:hypothetical protein AnigIFM63309_005793 [Aspergillus niger]|nr:hypothetical protein AnigIFM63309_005793 [Aspergillus niger]